MFSRKCKTAALFVILAISTTAFANDRGVDAVVGAVVGAAIGNSVGGRDGAIVGSVLGAAIGANANDHRGGYYYSAPVTSHRPVTTYYQAAPVYYETAPVYYAPRTVYVAPSYHREYRERYERHRYHEGRRHGYEQPVVRVERTVTRENYYGR